MTSLLLLFYGCQTRPVHELMYLMYLHGLATPQKPVACANASGNVIEFRTAISPACTSARYITEDQKCLSLSTTCDHSGFQRSLIKGTTFSC